jgi:hypothetical protein
VIHALESNADAQMFLDVHVWVSEGNTSTVRGTLLNNYVDTNEFATATAGLQIAQQTLSAVAAQVGDHIIVEIGYQAQNSTTSSRTGTVRYGGNDATDLTSGDTNTAHPGWVEFGTTITDAETRVDWQEKWYLGADTQNATSQVPAFRGAWTVTTSATVTAGDSLRTATPAATAGAMTLSTTATTQNLTRLLKQFVSPPLNAGMIPESLCRITGLTLENATDQDIVFCLYAYLMKANGDVRTVLLNLAADADADNEFPITTVTGRQSDEFAVAEATIVQDDRLVVEVGYKQLGTPAAAGNCTIRQGGTGADAQVGDTDTTKPTWINFAAVAAGAARRPSPVWVGL